MPTHSIRSLQQRLFAPIDAASLVCFRIAFGLVMAWDMYGFLSHGKVDFHFVEPVFYFKYLGFSWVEPWPQPWIYLHFYALGMLAICIAIGLLYRLAAALFALGYTYMFLLDQAQYQNHYYLICLVSILLVWIPAHRSFSLDARLFPTVRSPCVPSWSLWILRAQIGLVYFYGAVAKLNVDWLRGWPMRQWLPDSLYLPPFSGFLNSAVAAYAFSYAGLLIDLCAVPLLLWQRTRAGMLAILLAFHLVNSQIFSIGSFPYLGTALSLLFLSPSWPRALLRWPVPLAQPAREMTAPRPHPLVIALFMLYLGLQVLLPLRHWLYPGNPSWSEEGHRFAWHMKLRDKICHSSFLLEESATGQRWRVHPRKYLTERQSEKMGGRPHMLVQFARFLSEVERRPNDASIAVYAHVDCSLNGRPPFPLVDPTRDLAQVDYGLGSAEWILPLPASRAGTHYAP